MNRMSAALALLCSVFLLGACAGTGGADSGRVSPEALARLDRTLKDEISNGGLPGTVMLVKNLVAQTLR